MTRHNEFAYTVASLHTMHMVEHTDTRRSAEHAELQEYLSQKSRFERSVSHIQDALSEEVHGFMHMRDIEFDEEVGIIKVHIVAVNQNKEDKDVYGAKSESGFACFNLGPEQTSHMRKMFDERIVHSLMTLHHTYNQDELNSSVSIDNLYKQFNVSDEKGLQKIARRIAIEQTVVPLFAQIGHVESDHHGFGGSKFALEETALNDMPVWSDSPSTHRVKLLWTYMGSEKTRVSNLVGDVYDYTLEKHGVNQISRAIEETLVLIDASKAYSRREKRKDSPLLLQNIPDTMGHLFHADQSQRTEEVANGIESLTIKGHSMGGKVAYEMFKQQKKFTQQLRERFAGIEDQSVPKAVRYLLDATVTEGFESNKREATLLRGLWGYVMRLGSRSLPPQFSMPIAKELKIFRKAHKDIFHVDSDDRFHRQSNWHIINAESDPRVIAQHVRTLMKTPKMDARTEKGEAFDNDMWTDLMTMVVEGSVCATLAQEDTILLVSEQQQNLKQLFIPVFIALKENHYQIRNIIGALFANGRLNEEQVDQAVEYFSGWMRGKLVQPEGAFLKITKLYERQYALYRDVVTTACLSLPDAAEMHIQPSIIESIHEELLSVDIAGVMQQTTEGIIDKIMTLYKEKTSYKFSNDAARKQYFLDTVYQKTNSQVSKIRRKTKQVNDFFKTGLSDLPMEQALATALTLDWLQQSRVSRPETYNKKDVLAVQRYALITDAKKHAWMPNAAFNSLFSDLLHENGVQLIPFSELFLQFKERGQILSDYPENPYIKALEQSGLFSQRFVVTVLDDQLSMIQEALTPWVEHINDPGELSGMFEQLEDAKNLLTRSGRDIFRSKAYEVLHSVAGGINNQTQEYRNLVEFLSRKASPEAETLPADRFSKTRVMKRFSHDPAAREGVLDWYKEFVEKLQAFLQSQDA